MLRSLGMPVPPAPPEPTPPPAIAAALREGARLYEVVGEPHAD